MFASDCASQALGMQVLKVRPGAASLSMAVREDMLNGYQTCHGGLISALADSAFAFARNSYNELTVASGFSIDFIRAAGVPATACIPPTATDCSRAGWARTTAGLEVPFSCTSGVCGTCRAKLIEGEVRMERNYALDKRDVEAGFVLACQAHPLTDRVVLSFDER